MSGRRPIACGSPTARRNRQAGARCRVVPALKWSAPPSSADSLAASTDAPLLGLTPSRIIFAHPAFRADSPPRRAAGRDSAMASFSRLADRLARRRGAQWRSRRGISPTWASLFGEAEQPAEPVSTPAPFRGLRAPSIAAAISASAARAGGLRGHRAGPRRRPRSTLALGEGLVRAQVEEKGPPRLADRTTGERSRPSSAAARRAVSHHFSSPPSLGRLHRTPS